VSVSVSVAFDVRSHESCIDTAAARQISMNSSAFSDAPPIRPPSTSGCAKSSAAFFAVHRASVDDARRAGRVGTEELLQYAPHMRAADCASNGVAVLPGADRPHWFIGDDELAQVVDLDAREVLAQADLR
jgi:hypothetical protein